MLTVLLHYFFGAVILFIWLYALLAVVGAMGAYFPALRSFGLFERVMNWFLPHFDKLRGYLPDKLKGLVPLLYCLGIWIVLRASEYAFSLLPRVKF